MFTDVLPADEVNLAVGESGGVPIQCLLTSSVNCLMSTKMGIPVRPVLPVPLRKVDAMLGKQSRDWGTVMFAMHL